MSMQKDFRCTKIMMTEKLFFNLLFRKKFLRYDLERKSVCRPREILWISFFTSILQKLRRKFPRNDFGKKRWLSEIQFFKWYTLLIALTSQIFVGKQSMKFWWPKMLSRGNVRHAIPTIFTSKSTVGGTLNPIESLRKYHRFQQI